MTGSGKGIDFMILKNSVCTGFGDLRVNVLSRSIVLSQDTLKLFYIYFNRREPIKYFTSWSLCVKLSVYTSQICNVTFTRYGDVSTVG